MSLAILFVWLPAAMAEPLVLNEVLYDPEGADGGKEFIEIFNGGGQAMPLAGARLEFANGAVGPDWMTRWTGGEADTILAGGFFLVADNGWEGAPEPNGLANLDLQNGPDAIRLLLPDGSSDLLGYGELTESALFEGHPHPDVGSGCSLGRRPDGHDTDSNAEDWAELTIPTPGRPNFHSFGARVDRYICSPPSLPSVGGTVTVTIHLVNTGLQSIASSAVRLVDDKLHVELDAWLDSMEPDQGCVLQFSWQPAQAGWFSFLLEILDPGGESPLVIPAGAYFVGLARLCLNEVMAAPADGGCEWIEVLNTTHEPFDLGSVFLRDEDGEWRALPPIVLAPEQPFALVQDREKFLGWWEGLLAAGARPPCESGAPASFSAELPAAWPSLNNSPPADRDFADRVYLGDSAGTIWDHVTLGELDGEVPVGRSLERVAPVPKGDPRRNWGPATTAMGGTPACGNSLSFSGAQLGSLDLQPNPFYPAGSARQSVLHIQFELSEPETAWDVMIFDLWGRQVRDLGGDALGSGPRDVLWDGCDNEGDEVGYGAYVVLLRTYDERGRHLQGRKRLAVVGRDEGS